MESRVVELTDRLDRTNQEAMQEAADDSVRLASLQTAYDELKTQYENQQPEVII